MAKVEILEINAKQGQTTLKELRKDIIALKNELLNLEEGTEDYNKALTELGNKLFVLREINEQARASASDLGEMVGNTTNLASGLTSAFLGVAGALNLMGVESETTLQVLAQMLNLMALTQGLQGIDDGIKAYGRLKNQIKAVVAERKAEKAVLQATKVATDAQTTATLASNVALKAVKATLMSLGIGLIISALGYLIVNWDKVTTAVSKFFGKNEETNKQLEEQKEKIKNVTEELAIQLKEYEKYLKDRKIAKLNSEAKKSYEDLEDKLKDYNYQLEILDKQLTLSKTEEEYNNLKKQGVELQNNIKSIKEEQQAILDNADSYKELKKAKEEVANTPVEDPNLEKIDTIKERFKTEIELLKIKYEEEKALLEQYNEDTAKLTAEYEANLAKIREDERIKEQEARQNEYNQKNLELQVAYETSRAILAEQYATDLIDKETFENSLQALEETTLQKQKENLQVLLADESLTKEERLKLQTELTDTIIKLSDIATEHQEENTKKTGYVLSEQANKVFSTTDMFAGAVNDLLGAVSDNLEQGSKEWKAVNIAMATISMLQGVVSAMTSAFSPANAYLTIWGLIALAGITTATVLASGIANISKIKNTKENGTNTTSSNASTPSLPTTNSVSTSTNIDGLSNLDSAITSGRVTGSTVASKINSQKVYVTETDITNTQKKVDVLETETTF